jgi:hypothetical protein
MTVVSRYSCNLCQDEIVSTEKPGKHGVGIHFAGSHDIRFKMIQDAHQHLCDACVKAIAEERRALCEQDLRV